MVFLDQCCILAIRVETASSKHLFISIASLSWMEVNVLNQNPCMSSWPEVFRLGISFLSIALSELMCIFAFGPSSSPSNSSSMWLIHSAFLLCSLGCHILLKIVSFPCHPVVGMSSYNLPLLAGRIFFVVLECPVLSVLFYPISISF